MHVFPNLVTHADQGPYYPGILYTIVYENSLKKFNFWSLDVIKFSDYCKPQNLVTILIWHSWNTDA